MFYAYIFSSQLPILRLWNPSTLININGAIKAKTNDREPLGVASRYL